MMAKFTPSHLVASISGAVAGHTFRLTRNGPVLARRGLKRIHKSPAQLAAGTRWAAVTKHWANITDDQRKAWRSFARLLPKTNALGIPHVRNGFQQFLSHNSIAHFAGLSLEDDPPSLTQLPMLTFMVATFQNSAFYGVGVTIDAPLDPVYLILEGSRPMRFMPNIPPTPTKEIPAWRFRKWRFLQIFSLPTGSQSPHVTQAWNSILGRCQLGEMVGVRGSIWHPDALRSPLRLATDVVEV